MDTSKKPISSFKGLNNVVDPLRLGITWAAQADNVDINSDQMLSRCRGFTQRSTNFAITGAYATKDQKRLYIIDTGELRQVNADMTYSLLKAGLSSAKTWFEEINGVVFYANGVDYGMIEPSGWRPWGIEEPQSQPVLTWGTGSLPYGIYRVVCTYTDVYGLESANNFVTEIVGRGLLQITSIPHKAGYTTNVYATTHDGTVFMLLQAKAGVSCTMNDEVGLGREIPYWDLNGPQGTIIAFYAGQMYIAQYFPAQDYTAIWFSFPLHYHHFDFGSQGIVVPGEVRMLRGADKGLLIGTDRKIHAYDGEKLSELADYGVVTGWHASDFDGDVYFWSQRGLCSVFPFKNLTEATVSVAPGQSAGAMVLEKDGMRRYIVALRKDGSAYNRR
jgi:hypothetical protein